MNWKFTLSAALKFLAGFVLVWLLLFLSAGSFAFWQGWLLMGVLFLPMLCGGLVLLFRNPALLAKRLNAKEKQTDQNVVVKLSGLMFVAGFIVSGLGYRLNWYRLPFWVSVVGAVVLLLAYLMYASVLRENVFLSRTIEVQDNQHVIDTGLYSIVRHPMYTSTILLFLAMPLVLGSLYAFLIFLFYPLLIVLRIRGEEALLEEELDGYKEYKQKVKYRLIPWIW